MTARACMQQSRWLKWHPVAKHTLACIMKQSTLLSGSFEQVHHFENRFQERSIRHLVYEFQSEFSFHCWSLAFVADLFCLLFVTWVFVDIGVPGDFFTWNCKQFKPRTFVDSIMCILLQSDAHNLRGEVWNLIWRMIWALPGKSIEVDAFISYAVKHDGWASTELPPSAWEH